jgi:hypothetical protein
MHTTTVLSRCYAALAFGAGVANAAYTIQDTFDVSNFFSEFNFFTAADPTAGYVKYASAAAANTTGLAGYSGNSIYLGVDHTTANPPGGRASTRVTSNKAYTHGLFVADISHMPGGICGVWPAYWLVGSNWPADGEIDIIEGVNDYATNAMTLHTSAGCTMSGEGAQSGSVLANPNCNENTAFTGCATSTSNTQSYGAGFNANNGGVYAMEWTSTAIKVYFFTRSAIPADITSGTPNPASWGAPMASFTGGSGCNIDSHFVQQNIVFDTTFCGQWAGAVWGSSTCSSLASTCDAYVAQNPAAFEQAFWTINSVKVYQNSSAKRDTVPVHFSA